MKKRGNNLVKIRSLEQESKKKEIFYRGERRSFLQQQDFVKEQFEEMIRKNLKIPVNIIRL